MTSGAMFLVSKDLGKQLHKVDETTAHEMLFQDDTFVNFVKEVYEIPYLRNVKSDMLIISNDEEMKEFIDLLKLYVLDEKQREKVQDHLFHMMQEDKYCLIYHR